MSKFPTLEITPWYNPGEGCSIQCVFCPQTVLADAYKGAPNLTLGQFVHILGKVPKNVRITFAGFAEPFFSRATPDMIIYAHEQGHPVSVFTTGMGLTIENFERIKDIPYAGGPNGGFTLHLPDAHGLGKFVMSSLYLEILRRFSEGTISNFRVMCMGTPHESVVRLFPNYQKYPMWSRAGNLYKEALLRPAVQNYIFNGSYVKGVFTCGCDEGLEHTVMMPNGDLYLCCMDYGLEHRLGNLSHADSYEDLIPTEGEPFTLCNYCENRKPVKPA